MSESPTLLKRRSKLLLWALRAFCCLPVPLVMGIGRVLAWPLAALARGRRKVIIANLQLCLPELDPRSRNRLAAANLRSTALSLVENLLAWYAPSLRGRLQLDGMDHLQAALAKGQGVMLLVPHFTMIELVARAVAESSADANATVALAATQVVRRNNSTIVETVIDAGRKRWGPTLDKKDVRGMLRAFANNAIVLNAPDQNFSYGAVFAPFFGIPAATTTGPMKLAKRAACPALLCCVHRSSPRGHWRVQIDAALSDFPSVDPQADATRLNLLIEAAIRRHPEQYLWAHRRFRSRPEGAAALYQQELLKEHHRQQDGRNVNTVEPESDPRSS